MRLPLKTREIVIIHSELQTELRASFSRASYNGVTVGIRSSMTLLQNSQVLGRVQEDTLVRLLSSPATLEVTLI